MIQQPVRAEVAASPASRLTTLLSRVGLTPELLGFAALIFAISRVVLLALAPVVVRFAHVPIGAAGNPFFTPWEHFDTTYYAENAVNGYTVSSPNNWAFFPLQSVLMGLVRPFVGNDTPLAGIVVSNAAFFIALLGFGTLVMRDANADVARRAMLYLTIFPSALFFFTGYAESLFLALAIWCFVALRRGAWWQAGLLGLLAALTREPGLLLVVPFVWEYGSRHDWQWRRLRIDALAVALIPCGLAIFMAVLWLTVGDPLGMLHAQATWGRSFAFPPVTLVRAVQMLAQQRTLFDVIRLGADFGADLLVFVLILLGYRRIPTSELLFIIGVWLLAISYPPHDDWPLLSNARFMLEAFPCFFILARFTSKRWMHFAVSVVFAAGLLVLSQYFLRHKLIL